MTTSITPTPIAPVRPKREVHWCTRSLYKFIMSRQATPFAWGSNDCSSFSADAVLAMTGVDIASDFRGLYSTEAGAAAAIEKITGIKGGTIADAAAYCCDKHGIPEWRFPLMAQRGDLCIYRDSGNLVSGIIHLSGRHVISPGEHGLKKLLIHDGKRSPIVRAWHI